MWQSLFMALFGGALVHAAHTASNWVTNRALKIPQNAKVDPSIRTLVNEGGQIVGHVIETQAAAQVSKSLGSAGPIFPGLMLLVALASMAFGSVVKADPIPFATNSAASATQHSDDLAVSSELMPAAGTGSDWEGIAAIGGVGAAVLLIESLFGSAQGGRSVQPAFVPVPELGSSVGLGGLGACLWLASFIGRSQRKPRPCASI